MPRQERAERSRASILEAAADEFDQHGYAGARLERIVERTGLTKGAVYFHFRSKLDLAKALVVEKYGNWPAIVAEIDASGLRGVEAAAELTRRVGAVFASDVRVRAAMALSQTILPPGPDADPYDHWVEVVAGYLEQEEGELPRGLSPREVAVVAVQGFFGAYMIAAERGRLDGLPADIDRLWRALGALATAPKGT
ncbi:TetR/AcrR family transcriptional regulator [Leifsonia shinshuensis]|uniref:TetR/AcrR family transcriptional regulator n=1 Tax=Leifsonia shinshuensis TaxID=150026 RepID=A0A7G6YET5_9MICO|nr:TetR/AcrR family transcriptional regulator [Leifsonia shinshuensis]QNE37000.1 TetR/AcrR family transcriptional regulator [Leifsonia shinshuensis]